MDFLNVVKQTNNTMLFQSFNEDTIDLVTLLSNSKNDEGLDDSILDEINQKLIVKSFEEFLDKFAPTFYLMYDDKGIPIYTTKDPKQDNVIKQKIDLDNTVFKMLTQIINKKGVSGDVNIDFEYKEILGLISPKSVVDDAKKLRKLLAYNTEKYFELEEENPKRNEYAGNILQIREKAVKIYKEDPMALLPLAIDDAETKLQLIGVSSSLSEEKEDYKLLRGYTTWGESGEIKFLPFSGNKETSLTDNKKFLETKAQKWIEADYSKHIKDDSKNEFTKAIVLSSFSSTLPAKVEDVEKLKQNYSTMVKYYKNKIESFMEIAKPIIQTLLGVKVFFDQIRSTEVNLLVTNNSVYDFFKETELLDLFLKSSAKDLNKKIYFSIIPNIEYLDKTTSYTSINLDDSIDLGNKNEENRKDVNSVSSVNSILNILENNKVHSFLSFQPSKETNFNAIHKKGLKPIKEKAEKIRKSEYSILAIPNLTILPDDKSLVAIGRKLDKDFNLTEKEEKSVLGGIYLDASFLATGLVAAWQNPKELKERKFEHFHKQLPGVRFNIEDGDNNLIFRTSVGKESLKSYSEKIIEELNEENFGFVFSSDLAYLNGEEIKNLYVHNARSLKKGGDDRYKPIYKKLTTDFLETYLKVTTQQKSDKIKEFIRETYRKLDDDDMRINVNALFQKDDTLKYEDKKITVKFGEEVERVNIEVKEE